MTIEFLRARLLSERSVSKAARERAEHLAKKVLELEDRLEHEIQLRKSLEAARLEALTKYRDELITDYGYFFVSNSGEENSEGFLQSSGREDEKVSTMGRMHEGDSSRHLDSGQDQNDGTMNDEDVEQMGREKGILAWGRRGGMRRLQDGISADRFGRIFSQKSISPASADGESPQKRWFGKSVRQIRRKETRPQDSNSEEGSMQTQDAEDGDAKSGDQDNLKDGLQCDEEKDTEVERVLEHQAELIGQFEAEENAQRAWEQKFRERDISISSGNGQVEERSKEEQSNDEIWLKEGAATPTKADEHLSAQLLEDVATTQQLEKPEVDNHHSEGSDLKKGMLPIPSRIVPTTRLEDSNRGGNNASSLGTINEDTPDSDALRSDTGSYLGRRDVAQSKDNLPEVRQPGAVEEAQDKKTDDMAGPLPSEFDVYTKAADTSQGQNFPLTDTELIQGTLNDSQSLSNTTVRTSQAKISINDSDVGEEQMRTSPARHEGVSKLGMHMKQFSSSFKFNVNMAPSSPNINMPTEDVASTSHQPFYLRTDHEEDGHMKGSNEQKGFITSSTAKGTSADHHASGLSATKIMQNSFTGVEAPFNKDQARMVGNERAHTLGEVHARAVSRGDFSFGMTTPNDWRGLRDQGRGAYWMGEGSQKEGESGFVDDQNLQVSGASYGFDRAQSDTSDKSNVSRARKGGEGEAMVDTGEGTAQRSNSQSPIDSGNGLMYAKASHASSDNVMNDSFCDDVLLRRMRTLEPPQNTYRFPPHPNLHMRQMQYESASRYGMKFDNPLSIPANRPGLPDYSVSPLGRYGNVGHVNQDMGFGSHRKPADGGFDRVMDVLRALQIAKHQVESSDEPAMLAGDFDGGYNARGGFYMDQPPHATFSAQPPIPEYPAGSQYNVGGVAPHQWSHSTGFKPVMPDLVPGGAPGASSSSRQPSNLQYAARMTQTRPLQYHPWTPQYAYNSNIIPQRQDARQHR